MLEVSDQSEVLRRPQKLRQQFIPVLSQFNRLLGDAQAQGIEVSIETVLCEGQMVVQANVNGADTVGGRTLAKLHGLEP